MKLYESGTAFLTRSDIDQINALGNRSDVESIHIHYDPKTELKAVVVIHDTNLGPALGGCRCVEYGTVMEAVRDALRLATGMTYKAAIAGLHLGGGKAVVLKPKILKDRVEYFKAFGRFIEEMNTKQNVPYITSVDSGTTTADADVMETQTRFVIGGSASDPSYHTAIGLFAGLESAVKFKLGRDDLKGVQVSVQGAGKVGKLLLDYLISKGAVITVCDDRYRANPDYYEAATAYEKAGVKIVSDADIYDQPCDIFMPCALGAIINDETIPHLVKAGAKIIVGAANNQLADRNRHGQELMNRDILYVPDYVVNGGGLIYVAGLLDAIDGSSEECIQGIGRSLTQIFEDSERLNIPTSICADRVAEKRFKTENVPSEMIL